MHSEIKELENQADIFGENVAKLQQTEKLES
jgi:hypothetical protein